jgi:hypothetical protein
MKDYPDHQLLSPTPERRGAERITTKKRKKERNLSGGRKPEKEE